MHPKRGNTCQCKRTTTTMKHKKQKDKFNWKQTPDSKKEFNEEMTNNVNNDSNDDFINDTCPAEEFNKMTKKVANELTTDNNNELPWFQMSKDTLCEWTKKRDKSFKTHKDNPTEEHSREKHASLRKKLDRIKREAKDKWMTTKTSEIKTMDMNPKDSWKAMRKMKCGSHGHHKPAVKMKMKKADGTLANDHKENATVFKEHLQKSFNRNELSSYEPEASNETGQKQQLQTMIWLNHQT